MKIGTNMLSPSPEQVGLTAMIVIAVEMNRIKTRKTMTSKTLT